MKGIPTMNKNLLSKVEHVAGLAWKTIGAVTVVTFLHDFAPVLGGATDTNIGNLSYWTAGFTGALHAAEASARKAGAGVLGSGS